MDNKEDIKIKNNIIAIIKDFLFTINYEDNIKVINGKQYKVFDLIFLNKRIKEFKKKINAELNKI